MIAANQQKPDVVHDHAIVVENLTYAYPGVRAVDQVSFKLPANQITALVGPNGAGKTTLLNLLSGLLSPIQGDFIVNGTSGITELSKVQSSIGFLPDFYGHFPDLTAEQTLIHAAWRAGLRGSAVKARVDKVFSDLMLDNIRQQKTGQLSRGYLQRLGLGETLVKQPQVLLLDEPAAGLDPEARQHLSECLKVLASQGMTIVVSSHILAELADYCEAMLVMYEGRLIGHVTPNHPLMNHQQWRLKVSANHNDWQTALTAFEAQVNHTDGDTCYVKDTANVQLIVQALQNHPSVNEVSSPEPVSQTMSAVYLSLMQQAREKKS